MKMQFKIKRNILSIFCFLALNSISNHINANLTESDVSTVQSVYDQYNKLKTLSPTYYVTSVQKAIYKVRYNKNYFFYSSHEISKILDDPTEIGPVINDYLHHKHNNKIVKPDYLLSILFKEISIEKKSEIMSKFSHSEIANYLIQIANLYEIEIASVVPDIVFRPESGLVFPFQNISYVFVSNFTSKHGNGTRIEETKFNRQAFSDYGFQIIDVPAEYPFEGSAEVKYVKHGSHVDIIFGWGYRTSEKAISWVSNKMKEIMGEEFKKVNIITARMIDENYYHLDTALKEIPVIENGKIIRETIMYYPNAFDKKTQIRLAKAFPDALILSREDAESFASNSPSIDCSIIMDNRVSEKLKNELSQRGIKVISIDLSEFFKAGGGAKCLICELDQDLFSLKLEDNNLIQMIASPKGVFDVIYINDPYMSNSIGVINKALAEKQHAELIKVLENEGMKILFLNTDQFRHNYDFEALRNAVGEVIIEDGIDIRSTDDLFIQAMNTFNSHTSIEKSDSPLISKIIDRYWTIYNSFSKYSWSTLFRAMHTQKLNTESQEIVIDGKTVRYPEQFYNILETSKLQKTK